MKSILFILFFSIPLLTQAQFQKGDAFLGGTLSLSNQNTPTSSGTSSSDQFSVNPNVGFFLNSKFALGGQIGYTYSDASSDFPGFGTENKANTFSVGILGKWYFPLSEKFYFSLTGLVKYGKTSSTSTQTSGGTTTASSSNDSNLISATFQPSFIFFPSPRWGLEGGIGNIIYTHTNYVTSNYVSDNVNVNYGTITLGLAYYFRKSVTQ